MTCQLADEAAAQLKELRFTWALKDTEEQKMEETGQVPAKVKDKANDIVKGAGDLMTKARKSMEAVGGADVGDAKTKLVESMELLAEKLVPLNKVIMLGIISTLQAGAQRVDAISVAAASCLNEMKVIHAAHENLKVVANMANKGC